MKRCQRAETECISLDGAAKTSKMVPVLVVGALVWRKKYMTREWVAAGVILAG